MFYLRITPPADINYTTEIAKLVHALQILTGSPELLNGILKELPRFEKLLDKIQMGLYADTVDAIEQLKVELAAYAKTFNEEQAKQNPSTPTTRTLSKYKNGKPIYFKPKGLLDAQWETYCASLYRTIAGEQYVPRYRTYLDTVTLESCVGSTLVDFKSHHENPLTEDDLDLKNASLQIAYLKNLIRKKLSLVRDGINTQLGNQTYKAQFIAFFQTPDIEKQRDLLNTIIEELPYATFSDISEWADKLTHWLPYSDPKYTACNALKALRKFPEGMLDQTPLPMGMIESELDNEDRIKFAKLKGLGRTLILRHLLQDSDVNATNFSSDGITLDVEKSRKGVIREFISARLSKTVESESYKAAIEQIKSYLSIPLMTGLSYESFPDIPHSHYYQYWPTWENDTSRFIYEFVHHLIEQCIHPTEIEPIEVFASLLMPKLRELRDKFTIHTPIDPIIHLSYKLYILLKGLGNLTSPDKIQYKEERKILFTKLAELWTDLYQTFHNGLIGKEYGIRRALNIDKKGFNVLENQIFKDLSCHPVFIYYKNVSLLKYILTDSTLYFVLGELELGNVELRELAYEEETVSLKHTREVLIQSDAFKQFLLESGDEALALILEEFKALKTHKAEKLAQKPHYQDLVNCIDLEEIANRYAQLKCECFIDDETSEEDEDFWEPLHI